MYCGHFWVACLCASLDFGFIIVDFGGRLVLILSWALVGEVCLRLFYLCIDFRYYISFVICVACDWDLVGVVAWFCCYLEWVS